MLFVLAFGKTSEERSKDISRLAFVSAELARAGAAVIAAPSTPKEAARAALKETVLQSAGPGGNFFTIHVSTPLAACEERDRAGVYAAARRGELKGVREAECNRLTCCARTSSIVRSVSPVWVTSTSSTSESVSAESREEIRH